MEGLQRSAVSFRRQGSSGMVWDDKFLAGLNQLANEQEQQKKKEEQEAENSTANNNNNNNNHINDVKREEDGDVKMKSEKDQQAPSGAGGSPLPAIRVERSRSNGGGRGFRTGKVSPAVEPPSPRVSACGCFGKKSRASCGNKTRRRVAKKSVM